MPTVIVSGVIGAILGVVVWNILFLLGFVGLVNLGGMGVTVDELQLYLIIIGAILGGIVGWKVR